jgi:hypothetical protein
MLDGVDVDAFLAIEGVEEQSLLQRGQRPHVLKSWSLHAGPPFRVDVVLGRSRHRDVRGDIATPDPRPSGSDGTGLGDTDLYMPPAGCAQPPDDTVEVCAGSRSLREPGGGADSERPGQGCSATGSRPGGRPRPGPACHRRPGADLGAVLRPAPHLAVGIGTAPDALAPHDHHPAPTRGQIPHLYLATALGPGPTAAGGADDDARRRFHQLGAARRRPRSRPAVGTRPYPPARWHCHYSRIPPEPPRLLLPSTAARIARLRLAVVDSQPLLTGRLQVTLPPSSRRAVYRLAADALQQTANNRTCRPVARRPSHTRNDTKRSCAVTRAVAIRQRRQ